MRRAIASLSILASTCLFAALAACGDDSSHATASGADSGDGAKDATTANDAATNDAVPANDASNDGSIAPQDAGPPTVSVFASFDKSMGQLPEGLWEIAPNAVDFIGTTGTPITGFAPTGSVVTIGPDGHATAFGAVSATPQSTYTLGVTTDVAGNVYFAVAAAAAPPNDPAPGIYKFSPDGGAPTAFSLGSAVTPAMSFANGLDFVGADLFVADSEGVVYKLSPAGNASVWSQDPLLAPSASACGGMVPLAIGANGITHDANAVYVTNTNYGRIVKIPIEANGSAGTASVLKEDCATLVGADGILIDPSDDSFVIALNVLDEVVRVPHDGSSVSVIASGSPLINPASPILDTSSGKKRILVTGSAFFAAADAGSPNIVQIVFP